MGGSIRYRAVLFALLVIAAVVFVLPTFVSPVPSWWPWQRPVRLGLDLQGGTHLLYTVGIEQAVENTIDRVGRDLERELKAHQPPIGAFTVERAGQQLLIHVANKDKRQEVRGLLKDFPNLS